MAPLTTAMLSSLKQAIDEMPSEPCPFRNITPSALKKRKKFCVLFRKLLAKLAGDDIDEQIAFMVKQMRKISSKTYVKAVLESIPDPPDYNTLEKKTDKRMLESTA